MGDSVGERKYERYVWVIVLEKESMRDVCGMCGW